MAFAFLVSQKTKQKTIVKTDASARRFDGLPAGEIHEWCIGT